MASNKTKSMQEFISDMRTGVREDTGKRQNLMDSLPNNPKKKRSSRADQAEFPYDGSGQPFPDREQRLRKNEAYTSFDIFRDRSEEGYLQRIEDEGVYPIRDPESIYQLGGSMKGTPEQISMEYAFGTYLAAVYLQSKLKGKNVSVDHFLDTASSILSFTDFRGEADVQIVDICVSYLMYTNQNPMVAMANAKNAYRAKYGKKIGIDATALGFAYVEVQDNKVMDVESEDLSNRISEHLVPPYAAKHDAVVDIAEAIGAAYGVTEIHDHKNFLDKICEGKTFQMPSSGIEFQKLSDVVGLTAHKPVPVVASRALQVQAYRLANYLFGTEVLFVRDAKDNISADYRKGSDVHKVIPLPKDNAHASNLLLSTVMAYDDILLKMTEIEMISQQLESSEKKEFSHVRILHEPFEFYYETYRTQPVGKLPETNNKYHTLYQGTMMSASDVKKIAYDVDHDSNRYYLFLMTVNEANQLRTEGYSGCPVVIDQGTNAVVWVPDVLAATINKNARVKDIALTVKPNFGFFALPTVQSAGKKSMSKAWFVSTFYALVERYQPDAPVLKIIRAKSGFTNTNIKKAPEDIGNLLFSRSRRSYEKHGYTSMMSLMISFPPAGIRSIIKHNSVGFPNTRVFSTDFDLSTVDNLSRKTKKKGRTRDEDLPFQEYADDESDQDHPSGGPPPRYEDEFGGDADDVDQEDLAPSDTKVTNTETRATED